MCSQLPIRLVIIPPLVVIPGLVSYKLYGDIGDAAFGRIVGDVLPYGFRVPSRLTSQQPC